MKNNQAMDDLEHLKLHLKEKTIIVGIGNTLRSDDGAGSILASAIKEKVPFAVLTADTSPENYLGKIIKQEPENLLIIDAADFGGKPGDFRVIESQDFKTVNFFSTHNSSLTLMINYLQSHIKIDIIILIIQPKSIKFGDTLSPEVEERVKKLENWFYEAFKEKG